MFSKICLSIIFLISAVHELVERDPEFVDPNHTAGMDVHSHSESALSRCAETDCDEISFKRDWKQWSPDTFNGQQMGMSLPETRHDRSFSQILKRIKSKRVQDHVSSDLGFESIRNNAELSRTLLQQIIQNVQRSQDFPPRSNRADSKENYHLQASYIPRLG